LVLKFHNLSNLSTKMIWDYRLIFQGREINWRDCCNQENNVGRLWEKKEQWRRVYPHTNCRVPKQLKNLQSLIFFFHFWSPCPNFFFVFLFSYLFLYFNIFEKDNINIDLIKLINDLKKKRIKNRTCQK
jgi:hypothetical protein